MKCVLANQFKNEGLRLAEWIYYHRELGITDFILVNDSSTDSSLDALNRISGVKIHILNSVSSNLEFENSSDTEKYRGNPNLAENIIANFKQINEVCKNIYGNQVYLGFFDVDEFLCYDSSDKLINILSKYSEKPVISIASLEVDSSKFEVDGTWVTQQTTQAMSSDSRKLSTRAGIVKSFQNLSHKDSHLFFTPPVDQYGLHIHYGGVFTEYCEYPEIEKLAFLHYRKPMYDFEFNHTLCVTSYPNVSIISKIAHEKYKKEQLL